jgi:hypothetical protein
MLNRRKIRSLIHRIAAVACAVILTISMPMAGRTVKAAGNGEVQAVLENIAGLTPAAPECQITMDFGGGRTFEIGPEMAMSLMKTNPDGSYYVSPASNYYEVDMDKVKALTAALGAIYPVTSNTLTFKTTGGATKKFQHTVFHDRILNTNSEADYLASAIMQGKKGAHAVNSILPDSYVEINLTGQKAYYYSQGKLLWSSDVVTGNTSLGRNTPEGVYYIRSKVRNTTLIGEDYASFVSYWMPFVGNSIGLHDASWRSRFGGGIYKTNGSHGCVNLPTGKAGPLYDLISVGTPVIAYY